MLANFMAKNFKSGVAGMSKMTKAYNSVGSTLSKGWNSNAATQFRSGFGKQMGGYKDTFGARSMQDLRGIGKGLDKAYGSGTGMYKTGMTAASAIGAGGALATADFLNPWGLGWGD